MRYVRSPPSVDGGAAMMRGQRAGASTQLKPRKQFGWPAGQVEHVETTTQHPMAVAASHSTSPLTQCKRAMKPPTLYEFWHTSSSSLEAMWCAGMEVAASSLVVLKLSAASCEARPLPIKDGRVVGEGVGIPPRMEARWARALAVPWGAMNECVGSR